MDHQAGGHAPPAADASGPGRTPPAGATARGLTVAQALALPALRGTEVLAGGAGLDRVVRRLAVAAAPEDLAGARAGELLLAAVPLRAGRGVGAVRLLRDLDDRGLAGVAVAADAGAVPREALRTADSIALPLLRLGAAVPPAEVPGRVLADVLAGRAAALERAERVHRALAEADRAGGGLAALAAALAGPLEGGVLVTAPRGRVLARAGLADGEAADPALFAEGGARFRTADLPLGLPAPEEGAPAPAPRAVQVPVLAGGVDHGRLVLVPHGRAAAPEDLALLERAAASAALVFTRGLAEAAAGAKYRGDLLRDLLAGHAGDPDDPDDTVRRCADLGWDVDRPLVAVVAEFPEPAGADEPAGAPAGAGPRPGPEPAAAWAAAARERDPGAAVAGYRREVVVLMGAGGGAPGRARRTAGEPPEGRDGAPARAARDLVAHMARESGGAGAAPDFTAGISRVARGPRDLPRAYEQARRAARVARRTRGPGAVAEFDALGVDRLLSLISDGTELRAFAAETLGELAETGSPEADDLRATLEALLDNNLNVAETARALHFHYNTLRYRIGKLERMLGPFSTDPQLRLDLLVALRVLRMRDPG
ncbi:PucR family transcriptional regulator [Streptomonospora sp. S1-112]|uniref:PucR family transcriptional regulator n=1 Tax=Streptomonospora mangrovi TaxID=2883123 RepID=A0A9X3SDK5_9ACTN|nr:PucR family transcriptional regulator [Streptomonospora mangrovi]MDA0562740.1 PucR family transcriptional regulator [Streptomonospora mangrovi]